MPRTHTSAQGPSWLILLSVLLIVGVGGLYFAWTAPTRLLVNVVSDDAFYYFGIARHIALGNGSTFDGINMTNGYHPLWCGVCTVVYKFLPDMFVSVRAVLTLGVALWMATIALLWRSLRRAGLPWMVLGTAVFLLPSARMTSFLSGMETGLLQLSLVLLFLVSNEHMLMGRKATKRGDLLLGALLTFVVLSRLDSVFALIGVALVLTMTQREGLRGLFWKWVRVLGLPIAALVIYGLLNGYVFGTMLPVSGWIKSSFPHIGFHLEYVTGSLWTTVSIAVVLVSLCALFRICRSEAVESDGGLAIMLALNVYVVLHLAYNVLFVKWALFSWYFQPYHVIMALDVAVLGSRAFAVTENKRLSYPVWGLIAIVMFVSIAGASARLIQISSPRASRGWTVFALEAADWARNSTPPDTVFAMKDAGVFGYFSDRRVVNLDGIVNSVEYQEYCRDGRLSDFLSKCGVDYFVQHALSPYTEKRYASEGLLQMKFWCHGFDCVAGSVRVLARDEVFRSQPYSLPGTSTTTSARIWRLRSSR